MANAIPEAKRFTLDDLAQAARTVLNEEVQEDVIVPKDSQVNPSDLILPVKSIQYEKHPPVLIPTPPNENEFVDIVADGVISLSTELQTRVVNRLLENLPRRRQLDIITPLTPGSREKPPHQLQGKASAEAELASELGLTDTETRLIVNGNRITLLRQVPEPDWVTNYGWRGTFRKYSPSLTPEATLMSLQDGDIRGIAINPKTMEVVVQPRRGPTVTFPFDSESGKAWLDIGKSSQEMAGPPTIIRRALNHFRSK